MSTTSGSIDEVSINTIRFLAVDAIQKANSGHPGMPMGCAPIAYKLYKDFMKHNPANPKWINRDRFVLSAGHGSMLLYSVLHLCGYGISLDDIKNFRQWGSITPGHPEFGLTPGVETTTGPLGQGIANAIGMAAAQDHLAARFNKDSYNLFDHYIYAIAGDGDMMEGVSHEAASFAGHNKLGKLIVFYDDNKITIDGDLSLAMSEDVAKRYEAYGWQVLHVDNVNDLPQIDKAIADAQSEKEKPSIIITKTKIGFGSPNKEGKSSSHGSPLGTDEVTLTKKNLGWFEDKTFFVPEEVKEIFSAVPVKGKEAEDEWNKMFAEYSAKYPEEAKLIKNLFDGKFEESWNEVLPKFENWNEGMATRSASGKVIAAITGAIPALVGGSADLSPSNNTSMPEVADFSAANKAGRYFRYGIREHAMGSIMNGMAYYGGIIPYSGTFMVFSDYMRPPMRMAALANLQAIYVFTHDSIGVGEDGPTHQPIEHLAAMRAIPNLTVIRPADANETVYAWKAALDKHDGPVALALTRQNLPVLDRNKYASAEGVLKGAYVLKDSEGTPDIIMMASGSEVSATLKAAEVLDSEGVKTRVVSFASWELFEAQSEEYKASVLPKEVTKRIAVEAGIKQGWEKYISSEGIAVCLDHFGASAPASELFERFGLNSANIVEKAKSIL